VNAEVPLARVAAPIREQVTDAIREQIISQRLAPGDRLIERELCQMTGASRASVREAMRQLESEGLITAIPQRGMVVAHVTLEDALDIYAVRAELEGLVAATFAARASDEQRDRLFAEAAHLEGATDIPTVLRVKSAVYQIMFEGARNTVAEQFLGSLQARVSLMRTKSLSAPGRPIESTREIAQLVEAIRSRDADAASAAARFHVRQAARALERVLLAEVAASAHADH
jgi:DNA-binding GntR family transcriptional regulator